MPGPSHEKTKRSSHIPALDGIRAVAVIAVLLLHCSYGYLRGGFLGVDLFFVLSGYLITRLLLKEFNESGGIRFDLFYLRRVYRLLPPILLLLSLVLLIRQFFPSLIDSPLSWWYSSLAVLGFFANFLFDDMGLLKHTWSLSIEEQFYFLWPVTLLLILKLSQRWWIRLIVPLALVMICVGLRAYLQFQGGDGLILYTFLFTRMDSLLLGAMTALLAESPPGLPLFAWLNRVRAAEVILLGLAVLLLVCDKDSPVLYYGGFTVFSFFFALLLLAVVGEERPTVLKTVLESRAAVWVGKRSYGLYLYHFPIFPLLELLRVKHSVLNFVVVSILRVIVSLAVAALSYHYVELPFLRKKVLFKWNMRSPDARAEPAIALDKP